MHEYNYRRLIASMNYGFQICTQDSHHYVYLELDKSLAYANRDLHEELTEAISDKKICLGNKFYGKLEDVLNKIDYFLHCLELRGLEEVYNSLYSS